MRLTDRLRNLLESARAPLALALLALVMALPSLSLGLQLDDRTYLRLFASGRAPLELLHEEAAALVQAKQRGVFSWWSGSDFSIHFLRPLTAWSHWLEFQLWPDSPWLMHLANCLLYAVLVCVAASIYRELSGADGKLAGLAAVMFAVNESHAQSVGWITSRHLVLASVFGLSALLFHVRGRMRRSGWLQVASVGCTALALLSAEFGVTSLAYLLAYALVLEPGPLRAKLASIWPQLLMGGCYLVAYAALGGGVRDAGWYRDPVTAPLELLGQGLADLPLWLLSLFGGEIASAALVLPQWLARVIAVVLLVPLLVLLVPPLAASKTARFYAIGTFASCLLLFATVPQDRMLMAMSFGGFGWLACFFRSVTETSSATVRSWGAGLRIPHLIIAPLMFVPMLAGVSAVDGAAQKLAKAVPAAGATQAIAVNLPLELLTNAASFVRPDPNVPLHQLYAGFSALSATRPDARTLELTAEDGWGTKPLERMFATAESLPKLGETRTMDGMSATVLAVSSAGLPSRVRFQFADALESPGRVWLVWDGMQPAPWKPPAIGARADVPAASMWSLMF